MNQILIIIICLTILSCGQQKKENPSSIDTTELTKTKKQLHQLSIERDSVKEELRDLTIRFKSLIQLVTGGIRYTDNKNSDIYGENYRVEIYQSEIYRSLYITRIEYYGEGQQRISARTRLDFENMTRKTEEQTSTMEFVKWIDFDEFQIKLNENKYHVEIVDSISFKILEE